MITIKKQERKRFETQQEREEHTRIRKRQNKRDQRKRDKEKTEQLKKNKLINFVKFFTNKYRKGFYLGLKDKELNKFISLTCKDTVSLNWLIYSSKTFISKLKSANILGDYLLIYEHDGGNYHTHILAYITDSDQLNELIKLWKFGNKKIVDVVDQASKETHINYCTKQLNPDNSNPNTQRLIDSWELDLVSNVAKDSILISSMTTKAPTHSATLLPLDKVNTGITDLPVTPIMSGSKVTQYKEMAYHFLFWIILIALCCISFQAI